MPEATKLDDIYSVVAETARLLDVTCSPERVRPVLAAYEGSLPDAHIIFSMATGKRHLGELEFDFTLPVQGGDPYDIAVSSGLVEKVDHPITGLLSDIQASCSVDSFGVDYSVIGGFKKTYLFFPLGSPQSLSTLVGLPSVPPGLAEHTALFEGYGIADKVSAIAIDYTSRTWNVYFSGLPAEAVEPKAVRAMLGELGLPEPSEQMSEFIQTSFAMYPTFGWDSSKTERISFSARTTDPMALPARFEPSIGKFAKGVPYTYEGERTLVYAGALSPSEEYYKLAVYSQKTSGLSDRVRPAS